MYKTEDIQGRLSDSLSASEAVYGLLAWLTTREKEVTFSSKHDSGSAAEIAQSFCEANNLHKLRDNWADNVNRPE